MCFKKITAAVYIRYRPSIVASFNGPVDYVHYEAISADRRRIVQKGILYCDLLNELLSLQYRNQ